MTESESAVLPLHNTAMWNLQVVLYNAAATMSSLFCTKIAFCGGSKILRMQAPCGRRQPPPQNHIKPTGGRGTPPLQTVTLLRAEEVALVFKHQQHADCRRQQEQEANCNKNRVLHA